MSYKLIIFDFDGTLANSLDWFRVHINIAAEKFRFKKLQDADYELLHYMSARDIVHYLQIPWWKQPLIARYMRKKMNADITSFALHEGCPEVLGLLSKKAELRILSSNSKENIQMILGPRLASLFQSLECGISLFGKERKIRNLLRNSSLQPAEIIYIGDEIRDIEAAKKAGVHAGFVSWGYTHVDAVKDLRPEKILRSPNELLSLI